MTEFTVRTSEHAQFVEITSQVRQAVEKNGVRDGVCTVFVPHTTAREESRTNSHWLK